LRARLALFSREKHEHRRFCEAGGGRTPEEEGNIRDVDRVASNDQRENLECLGIVFFKSKSVKFH